MVEYHSTSKLKRIQQTRLAAFPLCVGTEIITPRAMTEKQKRNN